MPAWQRAKIDRATLIPPLGTPAGSKAAGAGSRITLSFRPVPFSPVRLFWDAEIDQFAWNDHFCDLQLRGPFRYWHHCHRVAPETRNGVTGTLLTDDLHYEMPLGPLGALANWLAVSGQIRATFAFRHRRTEELPPLVSAFLFTASSGHALMGAPQLAHRPPSIYLGDTPMKKFLFACATFAFTIALTAPFALAADNPWLGTWKLDPAKSHFTGETLTYSKLPNGMMHYTDGSTTAFDFGIDGKEYPTVSGRTTAWTAPGDNAWDSVAKYKGTILSKTHRALSADGKTLTIHSTGTQPDGKTFDDESTWTRVTGTSGLAGKWKSTKVTISAPDSYTVSAKGDTMRWDIPGYKESVEGKTDGSDMPITGPTVPPGMTLAYKVTSAMAMSYVVKEKGKPVNYGTQTLAPDGKSFTDISWNPGKESEKTTGFYVKQ